MANIETEINSPNSKIFRRLLIKRRDKVTGAFEDDWLDISEDVTKWGRIKTSVDNSRASKIKFSTNSVTVANDEGRYNDESNNNSLWFGYASQQRTLARIETGFLSVTTGADGIISKAEFPKGVLWDSAIWDEPSASNWDGRGITFDGVILGDLAVSDKNTMSLDVRPLMQIFRDFPARNIDGYTSTGITASDFMFMLRDQTDSDGNYIFRPFFGNTASNWDIKITTTNYLNLNTTSAKDIIDRNCWDIIQRLSESERLIADVRSGSVFYFGSKEQSTNVAFDFYGVGTPNYEHGNTIKSIDKSLFRLSNFYSRVQLKWVDSDTETSYETREATLKVSGGNTVWNYGYRTLALENFWINSTATAEGIADDTFNEVSALKDEIEFTTSFVPHLSVLDRVTVTYDTSETESESLWDQNDWDTELTWDANKGDTISFNNEEFKLLSITLDLDKLTSKFVGRQA